MGRSSATERGNAGLRMLVTLLVVGLAGAVGYLAADVNHGRYRLVSADGRLAVERGRFFPFGFETYVPEVVALREAYAPLPLPQGAGAPADVVYSERADLDRAIFGLLAGWSRERMPSTDSGTLGLASEYLARAELLPALSEEQRAELHGLRGQLAYRHALARFVTVGGDMRKVRDELRLAVKLGGAEAAQVEAWVADIDRLLESYEELAGRLLPASAPAPALPSIIAPGQATTTPGGGSTGAKREDEGVQ